MTFRFYSRAELDRFGPHDLAPDALGVLELDLPDGTPVDVEVLPVGVRWRYGETGNMIEAP